MLTNLKKTVIALSATLALGTANANGLDPLMKALQSQPDTKKAEFLSPAAKGAEWLAMLPDTSGMYAVKLKTGQFMIMDSHFRYAFYANNLFDMIRGQEITTIEELNQVWLIDESKLDPNTLPIFSYGQEKPKADMTILVGVHKSEATKRLMQFVKENQEKYRIDLVLMGTTGKRQLFSVINLFCAKDRVLAKERLLNLEIPTYGDEESLLDYHATCNREHIMAGTAISKMYNVTHYPYFINGKGHSTIGIPKDLEKFLTELPENPSHSIDFSNEDWNK